MQNKFAKTLQTSSSPTDFKTSDTNKLCENAKCVLISPSGLEPQPMANALQPRKRVGSYPASNVIFSITTALFMIGLFLLFTVNASRLTQKLKEDIEVQILLSNDLSEIERGKLENALASKPYIDRQQNQPRIRYRSKEAWAEQMAAETGEDFVSFLGENPLRDAFLVNIRSDYYDSNHMKAIQQELQTLSGVFEVVYAERLVAKINANIARIGIVLGVFIAIFLITVVVLIHNSIKLALFSQRFLIRSMQLVGATGWFIKKPFLWQALWQGCLSGGIASGILAVLLWYSLQQIEELALLQNLGLNAAIFLGIVCLGGMVSTASAYLAVSRYLRMKLDELY